MNYAVIKTGGKQYKVSEGQILDIDKLSSGVGKIAFDQVLLIVSETGAKIGKPTINGAKIEAELLENVKGDKLRVSKYKSKVRYRRVTGFRALYSRIKIGKIGGKTDTKSVETPKKSTRRTKKS